MGAGLSATRSSRHARSPSQRNHVMLAARTAAPSPIRLKRSRYLTTWRSLSGSGSVFTSQRFYRCALPTTGRSYGDAYDTRDSCRGSSSETRAHPRAGLVGCSCDSQDDRGRACEVGEPACSARGQMDAGRARSKRLSPQKPMRAREALARGVIAGSSRAPAQLAGLTARARQGLGGYAGGVVLSIRCQRMKPHSSHEYATASSPPSSAWRVEWPSRSTQVVLAHIGHFRDSSTISLPTSLRIVDELHHDNL